MRRATGAADQHHAGRCLGDGVARARSLHRRRHAARTTRLSVVPDCHLVFRAPRTRGMASSRMYLMPPAGGISEFRGILGSRVAGYLILATSSAENLQVWRHCPATAKRRRGGTWCKALPEKRLGPERTRPGLPCTGDLISSRIPSKSGPAGDRIPNRGELFHARTRSP